MTDKNFKMLTKAITAGTLAAGVSYFFLGEKNLTFDVMGGYMVPGYLIVGGSVFTGSLLGEYASSKLTPKIKDWWPMMDVNTQKMVDDALPTLLAGASSVLAGGLLVQSIPTVQGGLSGFVLGAGSYLGSDMAIKSLLD